MNYDDLLKVALAGGLTFGVTSVATASPAPNSALKSRMSIVKCYGIHAAHDDDRNSPGHSRVGQDAKARDSNAFAAVSAGLCAKIVGGSTTPADKS